jgi:hypothetical protein
MGDRVQAENCLSIVHFGKQNHQGHIGGNQVKIVFGQIKVERLEVVAERGYCFIKFNFSNPSVLKVI